MTRVKALALVGWMFAAVSCAGCLSLAVALRRAHAEARRNAAIAPLPGPSALPADVSALDSGERRILVLGDSRVRRWMPVLEVDDAVVFLRGVGGETTRELRARAQSELAATRPAIVVIAAGINDVVAAGMNERVAAAILDATIENLAQVVALARDVGAEPILLTVPRPASPGFARRIAFWSDRIPSLTQRANERIRSLGEQTGARVIDIDGALAAGSDVLPPSFAVDALHFSPSAYGALNALLARELD